MGCSSSKGADNVSENNSNNINNNNEPVDGRPAVLNDDVDDDAESSPLWNDSDFVLSKINEKGCDLPRVIRMASIEFSQEVEIVDAVIQKNPNCFILVVERDGLALEHAPIGLQSDPAVVLAALRSSFGMAFEYASPTLRANREFVLAAVAVRFSADALEYASPSLQADREIVLTAVRNSGGALEYASPSLQADREIVLTAVRNSGGALQYASPTLRANREIVETAVKNHGWALEDAHDDLKKDPAIVLAAVQNDGKALQYAHDDLKKNPRIVLAAVQSAGEHLRYAHDDLKDSPAVVLAAVQKKTFLFEIVRDPVYSEYFLRLPIGFFGGALAYASPRLQNNYNVVLEAVQHNAGALACASPRLQNNRNVALAAVQISGWALVFAHDDIKKDYAVVLAATKKSPGVLEHCPHFFGRVHHAWHTVTTVLGPASAASKTDSWKRLLWENLTDLDEKIRLTRTKFGPMGLDHKILEYIQLEQSLDTVEEAIYLLPLVIAAVSIFH